MTTVKKLMVAASKFTDKEGKEKKNWVQVGKRICLYDGREFEVMFAHINWAAFIKNEQGEVMVSVFDDDKQGKSMGDQGKKHYDKLSGNKASSEEFEDSIPF